jgi:hypothetical protein
MARRKPQDDAHSDTGLPPILDELARDLPKGSDGYLGRKFLALSLAEDAREHDSTEARLRAKYAAATTAEVARNPFVRARQLAVQGRFASAGVIIRREIYNLGYSIAVTRLALDATDRMRSFEGRKKGAYQPETEYLARICKKHPYERTDDLYRILRAIAGNPGDKKNPTPGNCPFTTNNSTMPPTLLKRGKPYRQGTFRNAITQIKRSIAAGKFTDM